LPFVEQRVANPIIDFSLLRNRVFLSANLSLVISFLSLFAVSFILPFYLEELRGFHTIQVGLLLTPLPITIAVIAPISGSLADRIGTRWLAAGGLTIGCIGLVLISFLNAHSSVLDIIWRLVVTGAGQALFQSPNNSALMGSAPRNQQGSASGFLATGRVVGQSVSVALAGAIFAGLGGAAAGQALVSGRGSQGHIMALQTAFVNSFHAALTVCACICAVGVLTSLVRGKEDRINK
jgi:MFS family permease